MTRQNGPHLNTKWPLRINWGPQLFLQLVGERSVDGGANADRAHAFMRRATAACGVGIAAAGTTRVIWRKSALGLAIFPAWERCGEKKTTTRVCDKKPAAHNASAGQDADNGARERGGNQRVGPVLSGARDAARQSSGYTSDATQLGTPPPPLSVAALFQKPLAGGGSGKWNSINWELIGERSSGSRPDRCLLFDQVAIGSHFFCSHLTSSPLFRRVTSFQLCCLIHSHILE